MNLALAPGISHARLAADPAHRGRIRLGFAAIGPRSRYEGCTSASLRGAGFVANVPVTVRSERHARGVQETIALDVSYSDAESMGGGAQLDVCGHQVWIAPPYRPAVRELLRRALDLPVGGTTTAP